MVTPAIAPNDTTYASAIPYITLQEYKDAPTGVDISQLVPRAQPAQQDAQLAQVIARASSWIDNLCYQVLAATTDTQSGRYRLQSCGTVKIPLDRTPILEVDAVSWGWAPSTMVALTDLSNVWIGAKVIEVPILGTTSSIYPTSSPWFGRGEPFVTVTYVNGYPNTLTATASVSDATSIQVNSALGIYPGTVLSIYDGQNTEQITVAGTYTLGSTTLPLTSGTLFNHGAGLSVSNLPYAVKQAAISLTSCLIKQRGSEAIVMGSVRGGPSEKTALEAGGMEDFEIAVDLLDPFRRVI